MQVPVEAGMGMPDCAIKLSKPIVVSDRVRRVYPATTQPSFMETLLYPGQEPLPKNSKLQEISVDLPPQTIRVLGWNINWLVLFFIASIISGYSLKGVFKVEV